ncbi:MAG: peptide ABC transporter substrate-binding protein [Candidatus Doudnabacteria bacterium]|nr:peptide ABC transporter substrate-binding protein [Candidatus Doudnabacteria bacterium]
MNTFLTNIKSYLVRIWQGLRLVPNVRRNQIPLVLDSFTKKDFYLISAFILIFIAAGGFLIFNYTNSGQGTEPDFGGEIIEGLVGQPQFINPILSPASGVDTDISRVIYAQLLKFDDKLNLVPDLAEALPEISEDQKVYTLKLKQNLKWHDGKPIQADDIVFTVETIQNIDFESPLRANWSRVKVEKKDDQTVTFTLREISASFITNFTLQLVPKHIWENLSPTSFRLHNSNLSPVGSGPYMFREIKKTSDGTIRSLSLKANDTYHEGRPYIDRVTFKFYDDYDSLINAFQGKEVSSMGYLPFDRKSLDNNNKFQQHKFSLPQYQAVFFNLPKSPVLADKAVRQALWLSTDRQAIIDEVYLGYAKPAYGPILDGNLGYSPEVSTKTHTSLVEAADLLDKAGWVLDPTTNVRKKGNRNLEFSLATNNFVVNVKTAQILQSAWQQIGATVNLVIVSPQELQQDYIRSRNFDALLFFENTGPDPDPYPFWHSSQARDPGLNLSGFSNPDADKLLTSARQTTDVNIRTQSYEQFQNIIMNEIPAVFLNNVIYVYNTPHDLHGIGMETIIHPSERFLNIDKWYLETK